MTTLSGLSESTWRYRECAFFTKLRNLGQSAACFHEFLPSAARCVGWRSVASWSNLCTSASRRRTSCTNVGMVNKKCEHGRQRTLCKDCGGSGLCEHGREHRYCKECGGSSMCEHGRQRRYCKDCGGGVWSYASTSMLDLVGYSCGVCKVRECVCQPGGA